MNVTRHRMKLRQYVAMCVLADVEMKGTVSIEDVRRIEAEMAANPDALSEATAAHESSVSGRRPPRLPNSRTPEQRARRKAQAQERYRLLKADPVAYRAYLRRSNARERERYALRRAAAARLRAESCE